MPNCRKFIVRLIIKAGIICSISGVVSSGVVLLADTQLLEMENKASTQTESSSQRARELWEQAIAAKGGRARLYAVRNMVVSARRIGGNVPVHQESLSVFPNKVWLWTDQRPSIFGLRMTMYNYETGMKYVVQEGDPRTELEPIEAKEASLYRNAGMPDLLESQGFKPVPERASVGKVGRQSVDIIQTVLDGRRIDFALDRETHLPVRISLYSIFQGKTYETNTYLSDYVEVNGIKVASTVELEAGTKYKQNHQFNVEYNENIFVKAPPLEAGAEAWKPKR